MSETDFHERVYKIVRGIPRGMTLSYGEVARLAGSPGAARAVGSLMRKNSDPEIPCHRVIRSDGRAGK
ncbi:MAG: MGMT family protein [Candidatus Moranbacteria bacterium]|nr:MGMT family protein [Candidatus Moranbacteria bacterium]